MVLPCVQMFFHVWEHNPNVVLGMWSEFIKRQNLSGIVAPAHVISDMGLVRPQPPTAQLWPRCCTALYVATISV